jgi:HAE1 family hydrophobic/amphiphilic exporter-1
MRTTFAAVLIFILVGVAGPAFAQPANNQVRRLTIDEAVRLALENNLGVQIARINPQIQDLSIALARSAWVPTFTTVVQNTGTATPNTSVLSGASSGENKTTTDRFASNFGLLQQTPWGGSYQVGWDTTRSTTTNIFSTFSPQVQSSLSISIRQPLLRNFRIDNLRQQVILSEKNREIADIGVEQTVATTSRTVRNAYWDLAYAIASLGVQQQSLDLARESLRETNARIQIGTTPPIDAVAAEAEVAQREQAVILAQEQIETAQDALRALVFNPQSPDFWTTSIQPTELPAFQPISVDVDGAVRNALQMRTDLLEARKSIEEAGINIEYFRNQSLPDVTASFDYGLSGLGGTPVGRTNALGIPVVTNATSRSFGQVLSDIFGNQFPNWTLALNISYPIGHSQQEASLARAQLQNSQSVTQLKNAELQVVTQVRNVARQVQTNAKLVGATAASRSLAEQRLDAEQKKLAAGTSTQFLVFQAQRDLAQARNDELNAILSYNRSLVDLETVQRAPVAAGGGANVNTSAAATGGTGGGGTNAPTTGSVTTGGGGATNNGNGGIGSTQ